MYLIIQRDAHFMLPDRHEKWSIETVVEHQLATALSSAENCRDRRDTNGDDRFQSGWLLGDHIYIWYGRWWCLVRVVGSFTWHRIHFVVSSIRQIVHLYIQPVVQLIARLQTRFRICKNPSLAHPVNTIFELHRAGYVAAFVANKSEIFFAMEREYPQSGLV